VHGWSCRHPHTPTAPAQPGLITKERRRPARGAVALVRMCRGVFYEHAHTFPGAAVRARDGEITNPSEGCVLRACVLVRAGSFSPSCNASPADTVAQTRRVREPGGHAFDLRAAGVRELHARDMDNHHACIRGG
jgi:hypothetical protein